MRPDVRAGLWKWLIYREPTQPLGSYDFYLYVKDGLTPNGAVPAGAGAPAGAQPRPPRPGPGRQPERAASPAARRARPGQAGADRAGRAGAPGPGPPAG